MNKNKILVVNCLIFFAGSFSSKILSFALLPIFTRYLVSADYGYADIIFTSVAILIPCITLMIPDSLYRFLMDCTNVSERNKVVVNANIVAIAGLLVLVIPFVLCRELIGNLYWLIYLLLLANIAFLMLQQIARGTKQNILYAIAGVALTLVQLAASIYLVVGLGWKADALLIAAILGFFAGSLVLLFGVRKEIDSINWSCYSFEEIKIMIAYSAPLIPNALSWWCINYICRYVLLYFCGIGAVGLFSVSNKFPSIINMLNGVFMLAWQESAITEYNSSDRDEFYSKVFNVLAMFLFSMLLFLLPLTKIAIYYVVGNEYSDSWRYTPFLYYGAVFSVFAYFYGTNYISAKKTKEAFWTTLYSAIIAVVGCIILVPLLGTNGASLSLCISYLALWLIRHFTMKDIAKIKVNTGAFAYMAALNAVVYGLFMYSSITVQYFVAVGSLVPIYFINRNLLQKIFEKINARFL